MRKAAPRIPIPGLPGLARALAGLVCLGTALGGVAGAQGERPAEEIHGFAIPTTRLARTLVDRATGHLEAKRWNQAIKDLQELIEEHRSELVLDRRTATQLAPVHQSAADWAADELRSLPAEVLTLYRRWFEEPASAALNLARRRDDRQAVVEVAERWPVCEAATHAWWTLGDMELEVGNPDEARRAWHRALSRRLQEAFGDEAFQVFPGEPGDWTTAAEELDRVGIPLLPGERRRVELVEALLGEGHPLAVAADARRSPAGNLHLPGPAEGAHGAPGPGASIWPRPFRLPSPHPFERKYSGNFFPVRTGDLVLLSNSLQLFAVNAYSGVLAWQSEEIPGWARLEDYEREQFSKGIAYRGTMVAPAASKRVAVAALQVPVSDITNESFRNIKITTIIPDRRLYAFDVETGEPLWNHHPPPRWDGESGSFTDRMSVAGPPVITAGRVLVPMHRMAGRVEFYAACYDLASGELLWSTQLVSGQSALNMFARAEEEFSAPPLRVEGDRVIALTQLGAIASLDLFSGRVIWETLYDQLPPPSRSSYAAPRRQNRWDNAPPVVADGVVVIAPFDSRFLIGLDFETGETRWAVDHGWIEHLSGGSRAEIKVLLGADQRTVYLGGWPVIALKAAGGLYREAPRTLGWRYPSGEIENRESTLSRALLLDDRVIIPTRHERIEVDRFGGRRRHKPVPWKSGRSGNLLVDGGTLYTLTSRFLDGYFEWDTLLTRARDGHERAPEELEPTLYLASLLAERGRTESDAGHTDRARDWLAEAAGLLERFLQDDSPDWRVQAEMHRTLRSQSRVLTDLADSAGAVRSLHRARELAPDQDSLQKTILEEHELIREVDLEARRETLDALDDRCSSRSLIARKVANPVSPRGWRFQPTIDKPEDEFLLFKLEIPLWTSLQRADLFAELSDVDAELVELHGLLEEWGEYELPEETVAGMAANRIGELLTRFGREAYAPFEEAAQELLAEARAEHDSKLLTFVSALYPHSLAGREANDELLGWAIEDGEVEQVAEIVASELPEVWAPERADERESQLLLHLGAVLEAAGNREYSAALFRALGERAPGLESAVPLHAGADLSSLVQSHPAPEEPPEPEPPSFTPEVRAPAVFSGRHRYLGEIPPVRDNSPQPERVLLFARESAEQLSSVSLVAFSEQSLEEYAPTPIWTQGIPLSEQPSSWERSVALLPGAVILASSEGVVARHRQGGTWLWSWAVEQDGDVDSITAGGGLVLITVRAPGKYDLVVALDAKTGAVVWRTGINPMDVNRRLLVGDGRVVLMPRYQKTRGAVLDLFSGRLVFPFELPERLLRSSPDGAWIEKGLLIVPWFLSGRNADRNRIVAVSLDDGSLAWNVSFDEIANGRRELRSIVQHEDRTFLVLRPQSGMEREGVQSILVELHTVLGATARVGNLELASDERPIGVGQEERVVLEEPILYLRSFAAGTDELRIRSLHLPYGNVLWTQRLSVPRDTLFNSSVMRMPVASTTTVALVISTRDKERTRFGPAQTSLRFFDKSNGLPQGNLLLNSKLGTSSYISLHGLQGALIVAGEKLLEVMR